MSKDQNKLPQHEHDLIFEEKVLPRAYADNLSPQERPRAIILAGQPGAGKGGLKAAAETEFRSDILLVDPDELREFHPEAKDWQAQSPYGWSQQTNSDASTWAGDLRNAGVERRLNLLVDTTLGDVDNAIRLLKGLQDHGYQVEIRAMAAHYLESEHGVDQRFTSKLVDDGAGRDVPLHFHDKVYRNLPAVLDKVQEKTGVHIRIFDRDGMQHYDSLHDTRSPGLALHEARNARLRDPAVTATLSNNWR